MWFVVDYFCYWVVCYVGLMIVVMGGLDGIVFIGGIGENDVFVCVKIVEGFVWVGVVCDLKVNVSCFGCIE